MYWCTDKRYGTVMLAGSRRRNLATLLYKMSRFCLGLRKSAELTPPIASLIASGQIISSEPNMISGSSEREARTMQLQALPIRANLLLNSLRCFYAGLGLFAASALIAVGGSVASYYGQKLFFERTAVLAVATGTTAVLALYLGCTLMVHEGRAEPSPRGRVAHGRTSFRTSGVTPPTHSAPCALRTCELQRIPPKL